jgi:hypothetical protein
VIDTWLAEAPEVKIIFVDGANKVALQQEGDETTR